MFIVSWQPKIENNKWLAALILWWAGTNTLTYEKRTDIIDPYPGVKYHEFTLTLLHLINKKAPMLPLNTYCIQTLLTLDLCC